MSPFSRMARMLLILHSLLNMALGAYSFVNPGEYAAVTGVVEASDRALQSIGLATIAVGWYQLVFTLQGNRRMMASTISLRCGFAAVMSMWDRTPLMLYELCVVWFCLLAVVA